MKMFIDINWSASFIVLYATVSVVIAGAIEVDQQQQAATTIGSTNSLDSLQCAGFKSPVIGSVAPQQRWTHFATNTQISARFVPIDDLFEPNPNCTMMRATKRLLSNQIVQQTMTSTVLFTYCTQCSQCSYPGADINRVETHYIQTRRYLSKLLPPSTTLYLFVYDQRIPQRDSSTNTGYLYTDDVLSNDAYWMFIKNAADTTTLQQTQQILAAANGTQCQIQLAQPDTDGSDAMRSFSKTSVLFVSISFIILMVISLAWLVFYYVQRFRYAHAKDRLARRLFNAAKKALTRIPTRPLRAGDVELDADCPVCIEPYCLGDIVRSLPCRHVFHKTCVDPWLLEHRTCPMCKSDILKAFGYNFGHVDDVRGVGDGGGRGRGGGDEQVDSDDRASIDDTHNVGTSASDSVYPFPTMMMMMTNDGDIHDPFSLTPTDESMHAVQQVLHSGNASSFAIIPLTVHSCTIQQSNGTIDHQRQSSSPTLDNDATFTTASEPLSSIQPCTSQSPPPESTMVNGGGRRILLTPLRTSSMAPSTASDDGPTQVHVRSRSLNPLAIVPLSASSIRLKHSASSGRQKPTFRPSTSNAALARNHSSTDLGSIESL